MALNPSTRRNGLRVFDVDQIATIAALMLLLGPALPNTADAGAPTLLSPEVDHPITIDGRGDDWMGQPTHILRESLHVASAAHDDESLYLMFRFSDERLARRILTDGVMLWFNGDGKAKNKDDAYGVRYTGSKEIHEYLAARAEERGDDVGDDSPPSGSRRHGPPAGIARRSPKPGELTVVRFGVKEVVPEGAAEGADAASAVHDGVFCYELRIPLSDVGGKVAERSPAKLRRLAVGIQIGGRTEAEEENLQALMHEAGGPIDRGGTGGGPGGRPPGGGMGGPGSPRPGMGGTGGGRPGMDGGRRPSGPGVEWIKLDLEPAS